MKSAATFALVATLSGCVGYARYEYIEATPQTLSQELDEQQAIIADAKARRNFDKQLYESYDRFGLLLCRSNGEEILLKTAEMQGDQICGTISRPTYPVNYASPDPQQPQTACIPVDQIDQFGSPKKTIIFGMYPGMGEIPSCPK